MNWPATVANSTWIGSSLPAWMSFQCALDQPAKIQKNLLQHLLALNADCAYGCAHNFRTIQNYETFAQRVPLINYDDLEPWIERIRLGESRVLTSEPVTHLIPTSGSTGGRKLIPFTASLQREFDRALSPWVADLARRHPGILFGPAYWSITPLMQPIKANPSSVPIGFSNDASYLGGMKSWLVRSAMIAPDELSRVIDMDEFRFKTLLYLLRHRELRLISVWHPSFLTLLLDALPDCWDKLLAQIRQTQNKRACELKRADPRKPETLWPRLRVISCWGDGPAQVAMADLQSRFPNVCVQPKGLLATEAFVTIPFGKSHPVAVNSHFFEFIDAQGRMRLVHELCKHETYEVVVTTAGGLWRYRLNDFVQVAGFLGKTPSLRFLGRSGDVCDLFGEKLSEAFVTASIQEALSACSSTPRFVLLAPDECPEGWCYTIYFEGNSPRDLSEILDRTLRRNPHYAYCRDLGQLLPIRVFSVTSGGYAAFAYRQKKNGVRLGDIKPTSLSRLSGWSEYFSGAYIESSSIFQSSLR